MLRGISGWTRGRAKRGRETVERINTLAGKVVVLHYITGIPLVWMTSWPWFCICGFNQPWIENILKYCCTEDSHPLFLSFSLKQHSTTPIYLTFRLHQAVLWVISEVLGGYGRFCMVYVSFYVRIWALGDIGIHRGVLEPFPHGYWGILVYFNVLKKKNKLVNKIVG